jgi:hypothetical protein
MFGLSWGVLIPALLITILSAARLTRLVVNDHWPPIDYVKNRWDAWTDKTPRREGWQILLWCPWCLGPWMTALIGGWAVIDWLLDGVIDWPWWLFNGWLAVAYLVSMVVFHDEGRSDD